MVWSKWSFVGLVGESTVVQEHVLHFPTAFWLRCNADRGSLLSLRSRGIAGFVEAWLSERKQQEANRLVSKIAIGGDLSVNGADGR